MQTLQQQIEDLEWRYGQERPIPLGPSVLIASANQEEILLADDKPMPVRTRHLQPQRGASWLPHWPWRRRRQPQVALEPQAAPLTQQERLAELMQVVSDRSEVHPLIKRHRNPSEGICIGRETHNDIVIRDEGVSAMHAQITIVPSGAVIFDRDSQNGTFVNHQKLVPSAARPLGSGDCLRFGDRVFYFLSAERMRQFLKFRLAKRLAGTRMRLPAAR